MLTTSGELNQAGTQEEEKGRRRALSDELLTDIMGVVQDAQAKLNTWESQRDRIAKLLRSAEGFQKTDADIFNDVVISVNSLTMMLRQVLEELGLYGRTLKTQTTVAFSAARPSLREMVICRARATHADDRSLQRACSEAAWVNQACREQGLPVLSKDEIDRRAIKREA